MCVMQVVHRRVQGKAKGGEMLGCVIVLTEGLRCQQAGSGGGSGGGVGAWVLGLLMGPMFDGRAIGRVLRGGRYSLSYRVTFSIIGAISRAFLFCIRDT